jgi:hypothetical protein
MSTMAQGRADRLVVRLTLCLAAVLAVVAIFSQLQVAELRRQVASLSFAAAVPVPAAVDAPARRPTALIPVSAPEPAPAKPAAAPARAPLDELAHRLASRRPAGVDACARMESADAAVLGTLR